SLQPDQYWSAHSWLAGNRLRPQATLRQDDARGPRAAAAHGGAARCLAAAACSAAHRRSQPQSWRPEMTYTFIAAIAHDRLDGEDYREWTQRQLAEHGFRFSDGDLKRGDDLIGFYKFLDRDHGASVMPVEAQRALADPGPFSGTVAGYLSWTHTVDERV